jgi:hypothetical protein
MGAGGSDGKGLAWVSRRAGEMIFIYQTPLRLTTPSCKKLQMKMRIGSGQGANRETKMEEWALTKG